MTGQSAAATDCEINAIRSLYTELALRPEKEFGWNKGKENARALGYDARWLDALPDLAWESAAAVGNPFSVASLQPGDVVVDLGCGAGADACIAALMVGEQGRVIGGDVTPAMIEKAKRVAEILGLKNVAFHIGDMISIPVGDASVDVVISNGAINLSPYKPCVFAEAYRVLKPSGRLQFADMARTSVGQSETCASWADCVAGTLEPERYLDMLRGAGFERAEFVGFTGYKTADATTGAIFRADKKR
jgi:SAM-dependent methyltransferase